MFYGGILILVHNWLKSYQSGYQKLYAAVRCVVLFEAEIHFGVLAGLLAAVNLLAWSKVFHVKFYLYLSEPFFWEGFTYSDGFRTFVMLIIKVRFSVYMFVWVVGCFPREEKE